MGGEETVDEKLSPEERRESIKQAVALEGDAVTAWCCHLIKWTVREVRSDSI
ncbi:hypothetical protein CDL15_Pgr007845 [Punica granatum]|uniref:Uncharacterized protein n=1 Tax=Punica granatum TaxID=22663 RepID=A0A218XA28_PUNGR|nr:hypothetical protein CDL15_Pgr007845 [Punica granatum]